MLERDARVAAEWHQVTQQKSICGMYAIERRLLLVGRAAHRVTRKWKRHHASTPIVATAAPFLAAGALALWRETVVEIEARIAFQRAELAIGGKLIGRADEMTAPVAS